MITIPFFSACQSAITLQAEPIGEPAHPIDVQELSHHARAYQAEPTTTEFVLKLSRVDTIAILYGTLSINTDNIADHIVSIISSKFELQFVISTNHSANFSITQLYSNAQTTTNKPAKKNKVAKSTFFLRTFDTLFLVTAISIKANIKVIVPFSSFKLI